MGSRTAGSPFQASSARRALAERSSNLGGPAERKQYINRSSYPLNGAAGYWNSTTAGSVTLTHPSDTFPNLVTNGSHQESRSHPLIFVSKSPFPREKRVTFQEPPHSEKAKMKIRRPLILNASLPHPTVRKQMSETKILVVRKGITTVASALKTETADHSFALAKGNRSRSESSENDDHGRVQFTVDMVGFENDEIHLYAKGNKLVVEGFRPECLPSITSRRVKETVTLPGGVDPDNLKVSRDSRGVLYFQEAWKF